MTSRCVDEEELLRLLDGELTENRAERLRSHVRGCGVCAARSAELERTIRELGGPLPGFDGGATIEDVMRGLPTAVADPTAIAGWRAGGGREGISLRLGAGGRRAFYALAGVTAIAASIALVARPTGRRAGEDDGAFRPRGAAVEDSIARAVAVSVVRAARPREGLGEGSDVARDEAYAVRYRSLLRAPAYLLVFAVDAAGMVHWVAPAYLDPRSNPEPVALSPSSAMIALDPAMQLDGPSPGAMRFVAIVSPSPLHVRDVDDLRGADLATASLRARWPTADVRELATVHVAH